MQDAVIYSDCTLYEALQSKIPDSRLRQAAENIEKLGIGQIQVPLGFSLGGGSGLAVYVGIPARLKAVEAAWRQGFKKGVLFYRYKTSGKYAASFLPESQDHYPPRLSALFHLL